MNTLALALSLVGWLSGTLPQTSPEPTDDITWHDARGLTLEGAAFEDTLWPYDRLPARAQESVRNEVWELSRESAGLSVRFSTDAQEIRARWTLTQDQLDMPHMPASGVSGVDLYVRDGTGWRWLGTGMPIRRHENTSLLAKELQELPDGGSRDYLLHFPLYNGTESMEIGVPAGSSISPLPRPAERARPIVFYGTSITQGACASRPGMAHTAILGRRLDRPIVNLGFSGNGRMEPAVTALLAEIDAAAYVIDCLPNMNAEGVAQRTGPLVLALREARPDVPILLVEDRTYGYAHLRPTARARNDENRAALAEAYQALVEQGVSQLYTLEGASLLGSDGEATVDGSHPNDLGFMRQADAFAPVLRRLLGD